MEGLKWTDRVVAKAEQVEGVAVDLVAILAPWLAPVPSAYLVYRAAVERLEWHPAVAVAAAIAIEAIGVTSIVNALKLWDWNSMRSKAKGEKGDRRAPFELALAVCGVYVVVTIGLTVLMDVYPDLAFVAPAIFPVLALVGGLNIALRNGQKGREAERSDRLGRRLPKRVGRSNERGGSEPNVQINGEARVQKKERNGAGLNENGVLSGGDGGKRLVDGDMERLLLNVLGERPKASLRELGEAVGRSKGWAHGQVKRLEGEGRLVKNERGWEVVDGKD